MATLEENLKQLELTDSEITVFLKLASMGKASAVAIAQSTEINRTTVYSILKQLKNRGLVIEDLGRSVHEFRVSPASNLIQLIEEEERMLEIKKDAAEEIAKALSEMTQKADYIIPKIQFITEDKIDRFLYQQSPEWSQSMKVNDGFYWGFQDQYFAGSFSEWIDWYWKQTFSESVTLQLLSNDSEEERRVAANNYARRHIAFWKDTVKFTSTLWVMGDYVVTIVLSESPHHLVEIHDATLASNLREVFKTIWSDLKK